jgi:hypothetical protein
LSCVGAIELRVNPILPLYIQHSDFWPHVIRLLASGWCAQITLHELCDR